jgi:5-methylcytosine-specific restriction endonuclease McrA
MLERFQENEPEAIDLSYFGYCIFPAFSAWIRNKVREEQDYTCADCHEYDPNLEVHHILPQSKKGKDTIENAVGLCGPNVNDCHEAWDRKALDENVIYPGVPLDHRAKKSLMAMNGRRR